MYNTCDEYFSSSQAFFMSHDDNDYIFSYAGFESKEESANWTNLIKKI